MGLDMYLIAKKFFWIEDYKTNRQNDTAEEVKKLFPEMKNKDLNYVIFEVGYWRKANMIHQWFVENIQDNSDDCRKYIVTREELKLLKFKCEEVLENKNNLEKIEKILPTQSGFFFGNLSYDEFYFNNIERTIEIIDFCLSLDDEWEFEYQSSW